MENVEEQGVGGKFVNDRSSLYRDMKEIVEHRVDRLIDFRMGKGKDSRGVIKKAHLDQFCQDLVEELKNAIVGYNSAPEERKKKKR